MRCVAILGAAILLAACAPVAQTPPTSTPLSPTSLPPTAVPPTAVPPTAVAPTSAPAAPTSVPTAAPAGPTPEAILGYGQARSAAFIPGGETLAVASEAGVLVLGLPDLATQTFIPLAAGAFELDASPDGRSIAASTFVNGGAQTALIAADEVVRELTGHQPRFSPDGEALALAELDQTSGRYTTRLFALADGGELAAVPGEAPRFSPDGRLLITRDREVIVVSSREGVELLREPAFLAEVAPDSATLALSGPGGIVLIPVRDGALDTAARRVVSSSGARAMAYDAQSRLLAFTEAGLLRWATGAAQDPEVLRPGMDASIPNFGPNALLVALTQPIADAPSPLRLMRAEDGQIVYEEQEMEGGQPAFSPDGRQAAVVTGAGSLRLVDATAGQQAERRLPGYTLAIFGPEESLLAGRPGPQLDLFTDTTSELPAKSLGVYAFWLRPRAMRVSSDESIVAAVEYVSFGNTTGFSRAVWSSGVATPAGEPANLAELANGLLLPIPAVWDYAAATRTLAYVDEAGKVIFVGLEGQPRELPPAPELPAGAAARSIAFSPDGVRMAVGYDDGTLAVIESGILRPLSVDPFGDGAAIVALDWSPDGRLLGFGLAGGQVFSLEAGAESPVPVAGLPGSDPGVIAFSPDGLLVAVAGQTGFSVSEVGGVELLRRDGPTLSPAFSPDGTQFAAVRQGRVEIYRP